MTVKAERSQLGELLVEMGLVEREQLLTALSQQKLSGGRLGRILAERRVVDEDRMAKAIAARLGLEAVSLSSLKIHERVLALIPGSVALKYGALPIAIKRTNQAEFVYVVMADPLDSEALGELARVSGREIRVLVSTATELDRALEQHYRPPLPAPSRPPEPASTGSREKPPLDAQKRGLPPPSTTSPVQTDRPKPRPVLTSAPPPPATTNTTPKSDPPKALPKPAITGTNALPEKPAEKAASAPRNVLPPMKQALPPLPSPANSAMNKSGAMPVARPEARPEAPRVPPSGPVLPPRPQPPNPGSLAKDGVGSGEKRSTPSQGTSLPPLRPQIRDTQENPSFEVRRSTLPLVAPRVPTAEEDKTGLDLQLQELGRPLPDKSISASQDVESTLGEWDRAVRDWPRASSTPSLPHSVSSQATLPPNERGLLGLLAPIATQNVPPQSSMGELVLDPVTTEASLEEIGVEEEIALAVASDVPTSLPETRQTPPELDVEILEINEGPEDIKTSQVELSEDYEFQILRSAMPERPAEPVAKPERRFMRAMEIPVDFPDSPSPFEGPESIDVPVGLERTGIIPAIDWEGEEFVPPPLSKGPVAQALAGTDDIPTSSAVVRARSSSLDQTDPGDADTTDGPSDEVTIDPLHGRVEPRFDTLLEARAAAQEEKADAGKNLRPAEDSDATEMPVIEPSSLVSLIDDDGSAKSEDTGADEAPVLQHAEKNGALPRLPSATRLFDEEDRQLSPVKSPRAKKDSGEEEDTNPRIDGSSLRAALTSSTLVDEPVLAKEPLEKIEDPTPPHDESARDRVLDDLEGMFIARDRDRDRERERDRERDRDREPKLELVRTPLPSLATQPIKTNPGVERVAGEDEAARMVRALEANDSLNSAERAQLVLALGRVLLAKGLITSEELAAELRK